MQSEDQLVASTWCTATTQAFTPALRPAPNEPSTFAERNPANAPKLLQGVAFITIAGSPF